MSNLRRRLPPMNTLTAFEAAYRLGSFSRAAEELALSQGSVSRLVRQLEESIGERLFSRGRYDVAPTTAGREYAYTVRHSLSDIAQATDRMRLNSQDSETLTIYSDLGLGSAILTPCMGEFQRQHPQVRLRIVVSPEPIEETLEAFDFGLQQGRWAEQRFVIESIGDDLLFPVCSPDLFNSLNNPGDPQELASKPLLSLEQRNRAWPDWHEFLAEFDVTLPHSSTITVLNTYPMYLDLAELGEGVALGWARTVQDRLDAGSLVRVPNLSIPLPDYINVYHNRQAPTKPSSRAFVKLLKNRIKLEVLEPSTNGL